MMMPHRTNLEVAGSEGVHPDDDPATPTLRRKLTLRLLISAIRRYEETLAAARHMDAAYPKLALPKQAQDEATKAERRSWQRLVDQFDADFDAAELALASHIQNLFADLGGTEFLADVGEQAPFERAIRFEGTLYCLQYDVADYVRDSNIVAIVRPGRVLDLDCEDQASES
jgi:hypothetical protein